MTDTPTILVSFLSLGISGLTFYFYFKDRRREKFQTIAEYTKQLLEWHGETVELLIRIRLQIESGNSSSLKDDMAKLSAQIEKGRFFFPNIDRGDSFGNDKPCAYQGYRNLALDFLVYSYNLSQKEDAKKYVEHLLRLQREFTAVVFEVVRPKENLEEIKKITDRYWASDKIFEDFLKRDPSTIHFLAK